MMTIMAKIGRKVPFGLTAIFENLAGHEIITIGSEVRTYW